MPDAPRCAVACRAIWLVAAALAGVAGCARVAPGAGLGADAGGGGAPARDAPAASNAGLDVAAIHDSAPPPCLDLKCRRTTCAGGGTTSISGTAFAPNGTLPLFNVAVYIPNAALEPLPQGVVCDRCGGAGSAAQRAVAATVSDGQGKFKLTNVPVGKDIPLVVQVGKWRRQTIIPEVAACQDTALTDANLTRLPRNRGEGDMPRIAVTTGLCDSLGCLLPKVGVDPAELGIAGQDKAVTFFRGHNLEIVDPVNAKLGPVNGTDATTLWRSESELKKYDLTLLSCDCFEFENNKGPDAYDAMTRYLAQGGRIFGSDFMYIWYKFSTDPALRAALSIRGGAPPAKNPIVIDTSFPKGKALADWMKFVDPLITYGEITALTVYDNLSGAMPGTVQVWASSPGFGLTPAIHPRIVTINTPAMAAPEQQCGRAVHLDAHIANSRDDDEGSPDFPVSCGTTLNKGEEALAFLFFDLAACIQRDVDPIQIP
jgi:hypothetical protein